MESACASSHVIVEKLDGILEIRLNRPEKKNALTRQMYAAMIGAIKEAELDPTIGVVQLIGSDRFFTAGNDLQEFLDAKPEERDPVFDFLDVLSKCSKPLIATVKGPAIGIGATMLLHFDLVYAGTSASLRFPFLKMGLVPGAGASILLPRLVGPQRAAEILLFSETVDAQGALEAGLFAKVAPDDQVEALARSRALDLSGLSVEGLQTVKQWLKSDVSPRLQDQLDREYAVMRGLLRGSRAREAFGSVLDKDRG